MAFKIKIDGVEYVVDLPAYAMPYVNLLGNSLAEMPKSASTAKQLSEDLKAAMEEIARYVEPKPAEEHWLELVFKLVAELGKEVRRAVRAAGFSIESTERR